MADIAYRPRGELPPEDLRRRVVAQLARLGPRRLADELGMARDTVLGVAAGCRSLPGTAALLRERLPRLEEPSR